MDDMRAARSRLAADLRAVADQKRHAGITAGQDIQPDRLTGGQKVAAWIIGVPAVAGFLWLAHTFAPVVFAILVVIVAIGIVSVIWHAVDDAVRRSG